MDSERRGHPALAEAKESPPQTMSHYPALPPPIDVPLVTLPDHTCPYLPERVASDRAIWASAIPSDLYERFMDRGFRRSGKLLYQPACRGCRACLSIRVPVAQFRPSKSQRRCAKKNADLRVAIAAPRFSAEKFALYRKYIKQWHGRADAENAEALESFLYDSPMGGTLEFEYRDQASRLLAVGICDLCPTVLSGVYLFFDPDEARRGLGTFAALKEIEFAAAKELEFYYLGYWVAGCGAMEYKRNFRPNQVLHGDGVWRSLTE